MKDSKPLVYTGISKSIDKRPLFRDLRFEIAAGECIVLSGDNGEGKTTLLRILAGLLRPDDGSCCFNGRVRQWRQARSWLLRNVVYLHQAPYLFDISVVDNIAYGLRRRGYRARDARATAIDALRRNGLERLEQRSGKQLSGGERQRVALLRAWVLSPRLLLLDEPVASMDESARHLTLFLVRRLLQDKVSLVITAHEPRLFAPLATHHIRLKQGCLGEAPALSDSRAPPSGLWTPSDEGQNDQQHRS
jgi:ABC-type sulfate/molybdate transport systems ATPase subunit